MAQQIDQRTCTQCGVCLEACPNEGIEEFDGGFYILPGLCTECYGFSAEPQCIEVCPADAIKNDVDHPANEAQNAFRAAFIHPERMPRD